MESANTIIVAGLGLNKYQLKKLKPMEFNMINWHDTVIKKITIDRNAPGYNDVINFEILWTDETVSNLIFSDVYQANMLLGFGVIADESIYSAFIAPESDTDFIAFLDKWKGITLPDLHCYVINTNSTGSQMKIIAKSFRIE
jgi:hypothetical protein